MTRTGLFSPLQLVTDAATVVVYCMSPDLCRCWLCPRTYTRGRDGALPACPRVHVLLLRARACVRVVHESFISPDRLVAIKQGLRVPAGVATTLLVNTPEDFEVADPGTWTSTTTLELR